MTSILASYWSGSASALRDNPVLKQLRNRGIVSSGITQDTNCDLCNHQAVTFASSILDLISGLVLTLDVE